MFLRKKSLVFVMIICMFSQFSFSKEGEIMSLTKRQQDLVKISAYTASSKLDELQIAVNDGLNNGLSVAEIKDLMAQLYAYCGFPKAINGLGTLDKVVKERQKMGLKTTLGKENKIIDQKINSLEVGTDTQTKLVGNKVDMSAISADVDYYLKAHLFGDIFASKIFSWQEREIITVAALAAMNSTEPQRDAHINISKHNGITQAQIDEILAIAEQNKIISKDEFAKISPFGVGEPNPYSQYFSGNSYLNAISNEQVKMFNVVFEPSCRNNWHIHHAKSGGGQILIATAGRGYYQEWGKEAIEMKPGDVINIPANVKHWHGAAKDSWFAHIAVEVDGTQTSNEWLEPVSDKEYNKLK